MLQPPASSDEGSGTSMLPSHSAGMKLSDCIKTAGAHCEKGGQRQHHQRKQVLWSPPAAPTLPCVLAPLVSLLTNYLMLDFATSNFPPTGECFQSTCESIHQTPLNCCRCQLCCIDRKLAGRGTPIPQARRSLLPDPRSGPVGGAPAISAMQNGCQHFSSRNETV